MAQEWRLTIWGVRGSFPKSTMEKQVFGGNTSCISVSCGRTAIVLDAGSGFSNFGQYFLKENSGNRLNILISHLHFDHVMGLFFFSPMFNPNLEIHFYGREGLRACLESLVREPFWPVGFPNFPAKVHFHEFTAGSSFQIDDIQIDTMASNHPNECTLYRLSDGEKSIVHTLDCELTEGITPRLTEFSKQSDLLIWDANFNSDNLIQGWGHSTWEQGIAMRRSCGAKRIVMTHYNWLYTDEQLLQMEQAAKQADDSCCFAKEGMVITI